MVATIHVVVDDDLHDKIMEKKGERTWIKFFEDIAGEEKNG